MTHLKDGISSYFIRLLLYINYDAEMFNLHKFLYFKYML